MATYAATQLPTSLVRYYALGSVTPVRMRARVVATGDYVFWLAPAEDPLGTYWSNAGGVPFSGLSDVTVVG